MNICIKCGKENKNILCSKCKSTVDIEKLCNEIIEYNYDEESQPIFELIADEKGNLSEFRNIVFDLTEDMKSPKKEMLQIKALTCNYKYWTIRKDKKAIFYESANICLKSNEISKEEKDAILCISFSNRLRDYDYKETEDLAKLLKDKENLDKRIYYLLGDFYIKTRRYDLAQYYFEKRKERIDDTDDEEIINIIQDKFTEIKKRKTGEIKEYIPASEGNQEKYRKFMNGIGIDIDSPKPNISKKPTKKDIEKNKIPDEEYPSLKENEIKNNNFDTFVAFDLETTGFAGYDEIIEIGAIRVVNGKIEESEKFIFQELVNQGRKINPEVEMVTGITNEMIKGKGKIWEVFPRFMEFVKDDILVGYNCMAFDRRFLRRAGRYSNIIIKNKIYDIMQNLSKFDMERMQLVDISKELKVENPVAHRALADAVTTARVFMKLKEKGVTKEEKATKPTVSRISITGGRNQESDTVKEIWENLMEDCNSKEEKIIKKILKCNKENIEKPIYNANVALSNTKRKIIVNEIWKKSKTMLFLADNLEAYEKAKNTGWKCYIMNDKIDIEEFLERIAI